MAGTSAPELKRGLASPVVSRLHQSLIANTIFNIDTAQEKYEILLRGLGTYFYDWYNQQCRQCSEQVSIKSHAELIHVISSLQEHGATSKSVFQKLRQETDSSILDAKLKASIILAIRVSCGLSIGHISGYVPPGKVLPWSAPEDAEIRHYISSHFEPESLSDELVKLPRLFNVKNIADIAGIQICWSSNLADHLLMKDDESKVTLFHLATFLKLQGESKQ
jgi:hypothetical protein